MDELPSLLDRMSAILQCKRLTIRIHHDNLETVYVTREDDGSFLISDHNYTFDYLENGKDDYLAPNKLEPSVSEICAKHNVELVDICADESNLLPSMWIMRRAKTDEEVRRAVSSVAACVDEISDRACKHT